LSEIDTREIGLRHACGEERERWRDVFCADVRRLRDRALVELHDGLELAPIALRERARERVDRRWLRRVDACLGGGERAHERGAEIATALEERRGHAERVDLPVRERFARGLLDENDGAVVHDRTLEIWRVRVERVDLLLGEGGVLLFAVED